MIKSSKIYFTDVGLAAFLLGIHTAEQASRDPLRGNLYENLVIADIVKSALNRGIRPEIYFFRDSHGNEIDLLIREKGALIPVEIKSAATFSTEFIKRIEWFHALHIRRIMPGAVLYNGEQSFNIGISGLSIRSMWKTRGRRWFLPNRSPRFTGKAIPSADKTARSGKTVLWSFLLTGFSDSNCRF